MGTFHLVIRVNDFANLLAASDDGARRKVKWLIQAIAKTLLATNGDGLDVASIVNVEQLAHNKIRLAVGHIHQITNSAHSPPALVFACSVRHSSQLGSVALWFSHSGCSCLGLYGGLCFAQRAQISCPSASPRKR